MNQIQTITIKEYLTRKGIQFQEYGEELVVNCLFSNCDTGRTEGLGHLYFNTETSQYSCKKCGAQGNIFTLAKHLGRGIEDIALNNCQTPKKRMAGHTLDPVLVEKCYKAIPGRIRQYLNARGITDALISDYKLGWGEFYGKWWITIPVKDINGNFVFFKLRQNPNEGNKKITYPKGIEAQIYDWETLNNINDKIVICEGEFDRLILLSKKISAITSTHGAMTFKQEWCEKVKKIKKIYVCFDNDETGRKGAKRVATMLGNTKNQTYIITLPERIGESGDVTDYFVKHNGTAEDLFKKYAKEFIIEEEKKQNRIKKVDSPKEKITLRQWRNIIKGNFPELIFPAEVGLSIVSQFLIKDITNPFALVLIDVPSSGKTITVNFFSEIKELTYASDHFTPSSFVSNAANVKKEKLEEIDLLPRLQYKMFLIRDLSTLFSKREEDLNNCLGILTRVLDGEGLSTDTGIHGQRKYSGEYLFMMLAASTPIPPRVWKIMGNLGSRLFFLKINSKEKSEKELANQLTSLAYKTKEKTCRQATRNFLYSLWSQYSKGFDWDKTQDPQEYRLIIARCAKLLAKLRGVLNVWKDKSKDGEVYDYTHPVIEKPDRINQSFYNLCRSHALVDGRKQINRDDLRLIVELMIDSAPIIRARLFRNLLEKNGRMKTNEVETVLQCSKTTALKEMEALKILGVCHINQGNNQNVGGQEKEIELLGEFKWFLDDECKKIRGLSVDSKQNTMSDLLD